MKKRIVTLISLVSLILSSQAFAHFQLIYTPDAALENGGKVPLALVFTHPFDAGHTMDMGVPEQFFVLQSRGENPIKKIDLLDTLVPVSWQSLTNSGKAYKTDYTARGGDHIFCLVPDPYFEAEENAYIQQMTKVIINVGGIPGAWMEPAGLSAEIVPLCKPYDRWTGNVFQGKVLYNGKPVPGAEVEVEYLNHDLLTDHNVFAKPRRSKPPEFL